MMRRTIKSISLASVLALGGLLAAGATPARAQLFGISTPGFQMSIGGPGYYGGYYGGYPGYYGSYGLPYSGGTYGGYYPYGGGYYGGFGYPGYGVRSYSYSYPGFGYSSYRSYGYSPFGLRRGGYGFRRGIFGW